MSTVFVTQENPRLNYSDAERYGEVVFVNVDEYSPNANSIRNQNILDNIDRLMRQYDPTTDYLLLSGDPVSMLLTFNTAAEIARNSFELDSLRLLKWDGQNRSYNPIEIPIQVN